MKKKVIGLLASAGILFAYFGVAHSTNASGVYAGGPTYDMYGSGTEDDPWLIQNKDQWLDLASRVNNITPLDLTGKYIKLDADIDVGATTVGTSNSSNQFKGNFDGDGHTINITYNDVEAGYKAVFGIVAQNSVVKNLTVTGSVKGKADVVVQRLAGICAVNNGTIDNCVNEAEISAKGEGCGGICGENYGSITNCTSVGAIKAGGNIFGGIVGINDSGATVRNCSNNAPYLTDLDASAVATNCGGIVGANMGDVYNCNNGQFVNVAAGAQNVGGIVGANTGNIYNSINSGIIDTKGSRTAGIAGFSSGKICNTVNKGAVKGNAAEMVGGVFGEGRGSIINTVNYGFVTDTGCTKIGSFGGECSADCVITNCFNSSTFDGSRIGENNDNPNTVSKMSNAQANLGHGATYNGDDFVKEGKALIDILNEFVNDEANASVTTGFNNWTKTVDSEPIPKANLHRITLNPTQHGTISIASNYAVKDDILTVEDTPETGYQLTALVSNLGDGSNEDIFLRRQLIMPNEDVSISATFALSHVHSGELQEGKVATCFEAGYKSYYKCSCGNYYDDAACSNLPIAKNETELEQWKKDSGKVHQLNHFLQKVSGDEGSSKKDGYKDAYKCTFCGTYFEDYGQEREIGNEVEYQKWITTQGKVPYSGGNAGLIILIAAGGFVGAILIAWLIMLFIYMGSGKGIKFLIPTFKIFCKKDFSQKK